MKPFVLLKLIYRSRVLRAAALCLVVGGNFHALGLLKNLTRSDWANWVQAIGSIVAIGVAIFVMSRQNAHSARLVADADRLSRLRRAESVYAVLKRAHMRLGKIRVLTEIAPPADSVSDWRAQFIGHLATAQNIESTLRAIPAYDLGSYEMAEGVTQFADNVGVIVDIVNHLKTCPTEAGRTHVVDQNKKVFDILIVAMTTFERGMQSVKA